MKTSRTFSPVVSESLETRSVPSTFILPGAHAAAVTVPKTYPAGAFRQGDLPPFSVAPTGEKFAMNSVTLAPKATAATTTVRPNATTVTPPKTYPAGAFHQGELAPFSVSPTGEKFAMNRFSFRR